MSKAGILDTKREIKEAIRKGKIRVRNQIITNEDYRVNPKGEKVYFKDKLIKSSKKIYFLFNKPKGVVCQKNEKKSIYNIIKTLDLDETTKKSLFTMGRLDNDTSGLIIITNDGKLLDKVMHPKNKIEKTYVVETDKDVENMDIEKLRDGVFIDLDDKKYKTKPARVNYMNRNTIEVKIKEGKKRQVRRMFGALGYKVKKLKRVSIGDIKLGKLETRKFKQVSKEYIYKNILK